MGRGNDQILKYRRNHIHKNMQKKGVDSIMLNADAAGYMAKLSGEGREYDLEIEFNENLNHENLDRLKRMAFYYDGIQGLYRLETFQYLLKLKIKECQAYTIAAFKICHSRQIDVIYGKKISESLQKRIAQILKSRCKREEMVCRDSSDQFYLYLYECRKKSLEIQFQAMLEEISAEAQKLLSGYPAAFQFGAVVSVPKGRRRPYSPDQMLTYAASALAAAGTRPGNRICFFDEELYQKEQAENQMEIRKDQAIGKHEFLLYLQPKVDLSTGRLQSAEALVRWQWKKGKILTPDRFLGLFEKNGFCVQLDIFMLEEVCRLINAWKEKGIEPIPISVNLCKRSLYDRDFTDKAGSLLERFSIPSGMITLEILESMAFDDVEKTNQILGGLKDMGFRISMDDFGSGYSSLNALGKLNIDELKIDQSFLREMGDDEKEKIVLDMIIKLSRMLSISTVVEGVETREHESLVKHMGCDYGQGYLYSCPVPAEKFMEEYMKKES